MRLATLGLMIVLAATAFAGDGVDKPDFDTGTQAWPALGEARAAAKAAAPAQGRAAPSPEAPVWVSFASAELAALRAAGLAPVGPLLQGSGAAVFSVSADLLPALSRFMHESFHRCGGFFAHRTRLEAEADLAAARPKAGGPYTLDQQPCVKPLLARVSEAQLRGTIEALAAHHNRYYKADSGVQAARWLASRWQALAAPVPGASVRLVAHEGWKQPSVVLTLPGSDKADELVILGGHLDSISGWSGESARAPGADDNASGIAVLTEALRVLAEGGVRPRRTVQFMAYAAEEVGLRGSQDIAQQYARQGKKVVGVLQYDMTNFKGSAAEIYLLTDHVDDALTAFLGRLIDVYLGVKRSTLECGYACSDHASWTRSGFPSACPFESSFEQMNSHIHTERDTLENSGASAAHSVHFARLAVAAVVELAKPASFKPLPGA